MSEYLKWYDSYLDHTPTEDLAKNELESAHRKIKQLTESLAKANEDYKALFSAFQNCHDELVDANERVKELEVENSIIANSPDFTFDAVRGLFRQELNKFAIEKKIEALESFVLPYQQGVTKEYVKGGYGSLVLKAAQAEIEQLRKEQEK